MSHIPVTYTPEVQKIVDELKQRPFPELKNDNLIRAAKGMKVDTIPTWLHRQAGRYLPRFQAVRKQHGFFEVCRDPTLACEVTLEPIDTFPCLDASIIFSDILVIPQAIGVEVEMQDKVGPVIPQPIRTPEDLERVIFKPDVDASLQYVYDAIVVTRHGLGGRVPLIGFCGAPWTLFAYMCEGKSSKTYEESKKFIYHHPEAAHKLMQLITDSCITFLVGQAKAGAQMLQVFESSGGELGWEVFNEFALPYLLQIPTRVKAALKALNITSHITQHQTLSGDFVEDNSIPISCFPRMVSQALPYLAASDYDVLSLDHTVQPQIARTMVNNMHSVVALPAYAADHMKPVMTEYVKNGITLNAEKTAVVSVDRTITHSTTLQGNVDPYLLYADHHIIQDKVEKVICDFGLDRFICNLGHGMLPTHSPDAVATLTTTVKRISQRLVQERDGPTSQMLKNKTAKQHKPAQHKRKVKKNTHVNTQQSRKISTANGFAVGKQHVTTPQAFAKALAAAPHKVQRRFNANMAYLEKMRNIGISAHIDSGKTTLSERILFYGGRINAIHDVKGKDGVGAKMDSMDLEREKGITIQSAATQVKWKDYTINLIDTPGHVDFTIEVERALRVLDGAILVLCSVGGVQSQSITVDRQMKRYNVPRIAFINKLDRAGGNPWKPIDDMRRVLRLNAAAVQIPLGRESGFFGVVDIVQRKAYRFDGSSGENVVEIPIPDDEKELMEEKRKEMIERLADVDDQIGEFYMMEEEPPIDAIKQAIRRQTHATKFVPVFMGSAFKNKGVQLALDGVVDYLPSPTEVKNTAFDNDDNEKTVVLGNSPTAPLVALGFKLEESRFGQLTYLRMYQGTLKKGDNILDVNTNKKIKVPRLVRMSANEMEDVQEAKAGDIVALFGVECHSGTSFTDGSLRYTLSPITVPAPVISLAIKPKEPKDTTKFGKALQRFVKEDPTFTVTNDQESGQTLISGMGELHLDIYCERIRREYGCEVEVGYPEVNYRETIGSKAEFSYLHKKQSGGSGQYARVIGYIEPHDDPHENEFVNDLSGNNVPPEFVPAIQKGFEEVMRKGPQTGCMMQGVRFVIQDGQSHPVDSNEIAFRLATINGFKQAYKNANGAILEPVMEVEVTTPDEFQGSLVSDMTRRKGYINNVESRGDGSTIIQCEVPLAKMFGYSNFCRSASQGKAEYSMVYKDHAPAAQDDAKAIADKYHASLKNKDEDM